MKTTWSISCGEFNGGRQFCSVCGIFGLRFLPESLHSMQLSHFLWVASESFGYQKCFATIVILLMAGCPLCRSLITVVRRLEGTIILSSKNSSPYLVDNFCLYGLYSSGMLSYFFLSKHSMVHRSFGSLAVSVINS